MIITRRVRYTGDETVVVPSLNVQVDPGDEIDVPDDFRNAQFVEVAKKKSTTTKGDE